MNSTLSGDMYCMFRFLWWKRSSDPCTIRGIRVFYWLWDSIYDSVILKS